MKILILKRKFLYFVSILFLCLIFILLFIFKFNSYSIAASINKNSFLNIDISSKLDVITKSDKKIAYLTFDDGPTNTATSKILDILDDENIKATFFVVGKHVKEYPNLVKRAYESGHYIGNHGYSHNNKLLYQSMENFKNEIINTDLEISKAIGVNNYCSHIFRFPNGYISSLFKTQKNQAIEVLVDLDYVYVDWNCLNKDSEQKYSDYQLLNNLISTSKNKGTLIILMHDTTDVNKSYTVLKDSISYLRGQGYEFRNFYDFVNKEQTRHD